MNCTSQVFIIERRKSNIVEKMKRHMGHGISGSKRETGRNINFKKELWKKSNMVMGREDFFGPSQIINNIYLFY